MQSERYERFKAWLRSHRPEDPAGKVSDARECPIAYFLNETTPYSVDVREKVITVTPKQGEGPSRRLRPEPWMQDFIYHFDSSEPDRYVSHCYPWRTFGQCLEIVRDIDNADSGHAHVG